MPQTKVYRERQLRVGSYVYIGWKIKVLPEVTTNCHSLLWLDPTLLCAGIKFCYCL